MPDSTITVRLAERRDLERIGQVTGDAYAADGLFDVDTTYEKAVRDASSRFRDSEVWVAEVDGEVVGSVTYCPPGSFHRELARDDEGEFRMLGVSPAVRGRGVGRALVDRCVERAREQGLSAVVICSQTAMRAAHRLYDRMGFVRDPALDWSPVANVTLLAYRLSVVDPPGE